MILQTMDNGNPLEIDELKLLCLDWNQTYLDETREVLVGNHFNVDTARNLGEALERIALFDPAIIITEIISDDITPMQILRALRKQANHAVIIIYTVQEERRKKADRRLGHIFEYVEKPAPPHELIAHIRRGLDFYKERFLSLTLDQENDAHMRSQLEWLIWKEQSRITDKIEYGREMIENIRNSISQGMGLGGLVTLMDLISMRGKKEGDHFITPADTMELFFNTGDYVRGWLNNLETIGEAFSRNYPQIFMNGSEINSCVQNSIIRVEKFRNIKNQMIQKEDLTSPFTIIANRDALELVFRELLTNAFKYSPANTKIQIARYRTDNHFSIIVMNDILMEGGTTGIPGEMEHDIFEPFYKLNTYFDERFHEEEFGMGIGLTVVHNVITQLGGKVRLFEITDHVTGNRPLKRIVAEIILRIHGDEE